MQLQRISDVTGYEITIDEGLISLTTEQLATWIREARTHAKLTQEQLAQAAHVSKSNVSHWERGYHRARDDQLHLIAARTGYALPEAQVAPQTRTAPVSSQWDHWPFKRISPAKLQRLSERQVAVVEAALLGVTTGLGIDLRAKPSE